MPFLIFIDLAVIIIRGFQGTKGTKEMKGMKETIYGLHGM